MIKACVIGISGYGRVHYDLLMAAAAAGNVSVLGATVINQKEEHEKCACLEGIGCRIFEVQGGSSFYCDLEMASRQTMVVDAVHSKGKIRQIAGETEASPDGIAITYIPGIEKTLRAAYDNEAALMLED